MNTNMLYDPIDYTQWYYKKIKVLGPIEQQTVTKYIQDMCMNGSSIFDINISLVERINYIGSEVGVELTDDELEDINIVKHCAIQSLLN